MQINNEEYPFISLIAYGNGEYQGIIINQDPFVTSFYDFGVLKSLEEKEKLLEIGETWWWESNRQFPISIFCREQLQPLYYAIKTFNSKDTRIIEGPSINLTALCLQRVKNKTITLVKLPR